MRRLSRYPAPLDRLPPSEAAALLGASAAPLAATHWFQPSASDAEQLSAADARLPASGTIVGVISPTAIGSLAGGILDLQGSSGRIYLAITPDSPDKLRLDINAGAGAKIRTRAYTPGDAGLYDGTPKVAWGRWTTGGDMECGWGKPSDGLTSGTISVGTVTPEASAVADVAGYGVVDRSLGGEYEVGAFDRALSDAEIDAIVDALSIASVTSGRWLYPRPAPGVEDGDAITDPSTQVVDDTAHTWTVNTVDGTSSIQAVR